MNKPKSFHDLLQKLRDGNLITVESSSIFRRILSYKSGVYFEETPTRKGEISREETHGHLHVIVARDRRIRREHRRGKK